MGYTMLTGAWAWAAPARTRMATTATAVTAKRSLFMDFLLERRPGGRAPGSGRLGEWIDDSLQAHMWLCRPAFEVSGTTLTQREQASAEVGAAQFLPDHYGGPRGQEGRPP